MRTTLSSRIASLVCPLALMIWGGAATAMDINANYGNLTQSQRNLVDAVIAHWEGKLSEKPAKVTISFSFVAMSASEASGALSSWPEPGPDDPRVQAVGPLGATDMLTEDPATLKPTGARIRINNKYMWWEEVDPPPGGVWPNLNTYDMYSVLKHEIGHAIGFAGHATVPALRYTKYFRNITAPGGVPTYNAGGINARLTAGDQSHLDPAAHPGDLMNPSIGPCTRRDKSALDARILRHDMWNPKKGVYDHLVIATGSQEIPPNASTAVANVNLVIDTNNNLIHYNITHNVVGPTAAHIHGPAARDKNAGVIIGFPSAVSPMVGTLNYTSVEATLEPALLSDRTYVNIHSGAFPGGEVRTQIPAAPNFVPSLNEWGTIALALSLFGSGILLLVRRRRALA